MYFSHIQYLDLKFGSMFTLRSASLINITMNTFLRGCSEHSLPMSLFLVQIDPGECSQHVGCVERWRPVPLLFDTSFVLHHNSCPCCEEKSSYYEGHGCKHLRKRRIRSH